MADLPLFPNSIVSTNIDFITADDPNMFRDLTLLRRSTEEMPGRDDTELFQDNVYVFEMSFWDGSTVEIWADGNFANVAAAREEVLHLSGPLGKLPPFIRADLDRVNLNIGDHGAFAESEQAFFVVSTENMAIRRANNDMEETIFHESIHATLDQAILNTAAWQDAQDADNGFITTYAENNANLEDLAETAIFANTYFNAPERLSQDIRTALETHLQARMDFLEPIFTAAPENYDIQGDSSANLIDGLAGDDRIAGGDGNDRLRGFDGDDTLNGGAGADTILGGDGADTITGGSGGDDLSGGDGADRFIVNTVGDGYGDVVRGGGSGGADDQDVLDLTGSIPLGGSIVVNRTSVDSDGNGHNGIVTWLDASGAQTGQLTFENIETILPATPDPAPCFARKTRITTPQGEIPIEELTAGDLVFTRDHGMQPIRWIGSRVVPATAQMAPIRFNSGSIGNSRDLWVSPLHRMLIQGWQAQLIAGESEVLVPAKWLINDSGVVQQQGGTVEYFHILFDAHEVILADGAFSESFHPGHVGLGAFGDQTREEVLTLFPDLRLGEEHIYGPAARRTLAAKEAALLKPL